MSINNKEDANRYYQVINGLVDDYLDKWKVRPSNLKRYLQPGSERFNKFLERNKLKDSTAVCCDSTATTCDSTSVDTATVAK